MCEHEFVITYKRIFDVYRVSRQCIKCGLTYPNNSSGTCTSDYKDIRFTNCGNFTKVSFEYS